MKEREKQRIRSHQFNITERKSIYQEALSKAERLIKEIHEKIYDIDKESWKCIPSALRITKDTEKELKNGFEYLEELYQNKGLLSDKLTLSLAKNRTSGLFHGFKERLRGWLNPELDLGKEKGIDLTKEFQKYEEQVRYLKDIFKNQKIAITEEFEKIKEEKEIEEVRCNTYNASYNVSHEPYKPQS